jgi:steroid delta-isomerase-like uncharacterized protein
MPLSGAFAHLLVFILAAAGSPLAPADKATEIERLVHRYYEEAADQSDEAKSGKAINDLLSDDFSFTFGSGTTSTRGIDAHKRWLAWHHRVGANQAWTIQDLVVQGDSAAVRFLLRFDHRDTLYGIPATGKTVQIRGMDFFRVSGGRIVELYRVFDGRNVMIQLGASLPASEPTPALARP